MLGETRTVGPGGLIDLTRTPGLTPSDPPVQLEPR